MSSAPPYSLTPQERQYFSTLYASIHGGPGGVSPDPVVSLFAKATPALNTVVLGECWNLADYQASGTLTPQGFEIACRLVGHGQAGATITGDLIGKAGPLPKFEGIPLPALTTQTTGPGTPLSRSTATPAIAYVSPSDRERFLRMFHAQHPAHGLLGGDKAGALFMKSNLPTATLAQVWKLADTKERGELDGTEFIIGMHLIQKVMSGAIHAPLPDALPAGLYDSAAGGTRVAPAAASPALPPAPSAIPRQFTGQSVPSSPLRQQYTGQAPPPAAAAAIPLAQAATATMGSAWIISHAEKQQSDTWFDGLQLNAQGLLEGPQAVEFFTKSTLDQATLATVWDLCDMRNAGNLNKDEFAVATRLINDRLDGKPLPSILPPNLVPPSHRTGAASAAPSAASPAKSAVERDLFSLLDDEPPLPASSAVATPVAAPVRTLTSPPPRTAAVASPPLPSHVAARVASPVSTSHSMARSPDIMGADDTPSALTASSAEVGNLRTQLSSTQASLEKTRGERAQVETAVHSSSSDLAALQAQLEAARTAYTTESSLLSSLQTRAATQTSDLAALRSKLITSESDLSALRVERAEIEQSVLRDKEEIRTLKAKIAEIDRETERLKSEAESKKKEARQQRGMVAITKKQVERSEENRSAARADLESTAVAEPLVHSPAASVRSTNPFERIGGSGGATRPESVRGVSLDVAEGGINAISPQTTGSRQAPPPPPSRGKTTDTGGTSTSGVLGAIGVGAAAVGAATVAMAETVGLKSPAESEPVSNISHSGDESATDNRFPAIEDPAEGPEVAGSTSNGFDDVFGVPSPASATASAFDGTGIGVPAAKSATAATFDDAFGEVEAAPDRPAAVAKDVDDAFAAAVPVSAAVPVAALNGSDGAATAPRTTETGASTFDDAFAEEDDPHAASQALASHTTDAVDSSDDEEGPEPAEGFRYGKAPEAATKVESSPAADNSPYLPGAFASTSTAPKAPSIASSGGEDAFEDARQHIVGSPPGSRVASSAIKRPPITSELDDFDRAFEDLPPASAPSAGQGYRQVAASTPFDDDAFTQEFDRLDDFAPTTSVSSKAPTSSSAAFDAAFADFDTPASSSAAANNNGAFSAAFDDSFGSVPAYAPAAAATSTPATRYPPVGMPPALPQRNTSTLASQVGARDDDAPDVKQVCALGFTRQQAISALEKHSYNVQKAINSLLDTA